MTSIQVAFVILVLERFEILDHCTHSSRNRYKAKFTAATPTKSTSGNKHLLDTLEGKSPIRKSFECYRRRPKQTKESLHGKLWNCTGEALST